MKAIYALMLGALFIFMLPLASLADSPITSTPFYEAYLDFSIVKRAHDSGIMTTLIATYLSSSSHPVDVKMAVINALSWDYNGKSNGILYSYYLGLKYGVTIDKLNFDDLTPDEILCLGYLIIMDDYFNPDAGIPLLERANSREGDSFTYAIILAIANAQREMDYDWGEVWKSAERVFENDALKQDMRKDAVKIIRDYMELYK
jgi:hypothetical protein